VFNWLKKSLRLFGGSSAKQSVNIGNGGIRYISSPNDLPRVDEEGSLAIGSVYACVSLISRSLASLPLSVYKAASEASVKNPTHPLHWLLHDQPNPAMTSYEWRFATTANQLLWGNAFTWIQRDVTGKPMALYPLRSDRMTVEVEGSEISYVYRTGSRVVRYDSSEIAHFKGFSLDGVIGLSPISLASRTMQMSNAVEQFGTALFANGARPSGMLSHPGQLSAEAATKLREQFEKTYSGPDKAGKLIVLEEGLVYSQISINPVDAEWLSSRKFQVSEICRIFGIPEVLIGQMEKAMFGSIADLKSFFLTFTLLPIIKSFEQSLNAKLFGAGSQHFAKLNFDGFLRADQKTRFESYRIAREIGVFSVNDIRRLEELSDVEGGDDRLEPLNFAPLGSRKAEPEDDAPKALA